MDELEPLRGGPPAARESAACWTHPDHSRTREETKSMPRPSPTALMCRSCSATPAARRDPVSREAKAYTCSRCLGHDVSTGEDAGIARRQGGNSGSHGGAEGKSLSDAGLQRGLRDAANSAEKPLAGAQRRLGRPGRPTSKKPSRYARYRRRHPQYLARERRRLDELNKRRRSLAQPEQGGGRL